MLARVAAETENRPLSNWQGRLLPFMTHMVVGLAAFFFFASLAQFGYLQWNIRQQADPIFQSTGTMPEVAPDASLQDRLAEAHFRALVGLEREAMSRRYHQSSVLLMARIWTTYLGFVTGMILALVGAAFILGKLRESASELHVQGPLWAGSLMSASPGVILALLGTLLMVTAIVTHHPIETTDASLYFPGGLAQPAPAAAVPPRLDNPYEKQK